MHKKQDAMHFCSLSLQTVKVEHNFLLCVCVWGPEYEINVTYTCSFQVKQFKLHCIYQEAKVHVFKWKKK